nr:hypothetical protein [uncultured Haemophilus sp.]
MLDIKEKLLSIERERKQKYINIIDFFDFIKKRDEEVSFFEVAQYLYIELEPYDPPRNQEYFNAVSYWQWCEENEIKLYRVPKSISQPIIETNEVSFFYILEMMMDEIPFDNNESSSDYIDGKYHDLFLDRERMQELLKIEFSNQNTLKNTDINKSPIGTAERLSYQNLLNEKNSEITRLRTENTLLKAKIAELETVQAQPPKAVENIEQYNSRERNTHLQIIGGLVEQLSKTGSKFRKKDNPNYYAIADTIASVTADYENATKAETIRKRLAEAYKALTSEN